MLQLDASVKRYALQHQMLQRSGDRRAAVATVVLDMKDANKRVATDVGRYVRGHKRGHTCKRCNSDLDPEEENKRVGSGCNQIEVLQL